MAVCDSLPWEGVGRGLAYKPLPANSQAAAPLPKEGIMIFRTPVGITPTRAGKHFSHHLVIASVAWRSLRARLAVYLSCRDRLTRTSFAMTRGLSVYSLNFKPFIISSSTDLAFASSPALNSSLPVIVTL